VAIYEEIVWRVVVLQVIANYTNSVFAVISASGLFFLLHLGRFFNTNQAVEFFMFSLLLSILYLISGSLLHVIVIHFVRNVLISINSLGKDYDEENTRTLNH
jgi:membrane protease YdiL (CAAX protease family)